MLVPGVGFQVPCKVLIIALVVFGDSPYIVAIAFGSWISIDIGPNAVAKFFCQFVGEGPNHMATSTILQSCLNLSPKTVSPLSALVLKDLVSVHAIKGGNTTNKVDLICAMLIVPKGNHAVMPYWVRQGCSIFPFCNKYLRTAIPLLVRFSKSANLISANLGFISKGSSHLSDFQYYFSNPKSRVTKKKGTAS